MARRSLPMSLLGQWSARVFSVEMDGRSLPTYFALLRPRETSTTSSPTHRRQRPEEEEEEVPQPFSSAHGNARCYSLLVHSNDRIQRAKFYGGLKDRLLSVLPSQCELSAMSSFLPNVKDSVLKGYFLKDSSECSATTERVLSELVNGSEPVLAFSYVPVRDDAGAISRPSSSGSSRPPAWSQRLLWPRGGEGEEAMGVSESYCVVPCPEAPACHPASLSIINSDVFYSFEEAYSVLQECGDIIPEARAVLELAEQRREVGCKTDFPVIVIEGLDATGKTTLTESLRGVLGATLLRSPPQCLSPWRAHFDQEPPLIRRAFYALGNYITAQLIGQEARQTPVIVDRYWHSTAAYAIATAVSGPVSGLPADGWEGYRWPGDLLQPSLVVVLTLDPQERSRRLRGRGQGQTPEEQQLDHNHLFRLRVEEAYQRISGPACVTVDASLSPDQVLQQVLLLIRDKCHL